MHLTIIAAGVRMQRDCTPTELMAVARELQLRRESLANIPLRITVRCGDVIHLICNTKGDLT
jgi:hypothetical protein